MAAPDRCFRCGKGAASSTDLVRPDPDRNGFRWTGPDLDDSGSDRAGQNARRLDPPTPDPPGPADLVWACLASADLKTAGPVDRTALPNPGRTALGLAVNHPVSDRRGANPLVSDRPAWRRPVSDRLAGRVWTSWERAGQMQPDLAPGSPRCGGLAASPGQDHRRRSELRDPAPECL